jgi:phosphoglycerate dehydrogenase-like enzyme
MFDMDNQTTMTRSANRQSPEARGRQEGGREIRSALVALRYPEQHFSRLCEALGPGDVLRAALDDASAIAKALETVDVAIIPGDLDERFLSAPRLQWVHCDHAGLNGSAKPEVFARGLLVTGSAGRAAPALAQHIFFMALALTYDVNGLVEMKRKHIWRGLPGYSDRRGLWGKTVGIIGLGATGLETAAVAKCLGMRVLAYRKAQSGLPANVDKLYCADGGDTIDEILAESDVLALCIRLTDATHHMIGERELKLMKPTAYLINMARGGVVDEAALVRALHDGTIAGAGLDVFEQEPLPPDAPIWDTPNTIITPHMTAEMPDLQARSLDIIIENIRRYRAGKEMLNLLKPEDVYTK